MVVDDRFNRQELIKGWNQNSLKKTRVAIIGSGPLAESTSAALTALGIGCIEVYDNRIVEKNKKENLGREGFLTFTAREKDSRTKSIEHILSKINPTAQITGINLSLEKTNLLNILGTPDLIIDTTNSPKSKQQVLDYSQTKRIKVISASANNLTGKFFINCGESFKNEYLLQEYSDDTQGNTISGILGGIITEEVRKIVMPLEQDAKLIDQLEYSLDSPNRFNSSKKQSEESKKSKKNKKSKQNKKSEQNKKNRTLNNNNYRSSNISLLNKKVLIIGAGALGNFAALNIALEGVGHIDIMDHDDIESTNLNRQILFYDAVGKMKATALAERISEIVNPKNIYGKYENKNLINIGGIIDKLDEESTYFEENKPDLILDCVDSFAVRAIINYYAVRHQIPLVSGGTNPRSGQVSIYVPGKSSCLDCKLGVEEALAEQRAAASCRYAPDPSVIMTNQIVGNMIVGEAVKILTNDITHAEDYVKKILKYDSTSAQRGGLIGSKYPCDCTKPEVNQWLKNVDKKAPKRKNTVSKDANE
ncbi:hypothetical protein HOK51_05735 [Candidatus Woesearchaeota archaeon]|jgi:molybdopterin-synthase adenylyltransferase|nr:hypothetical protein [Candidatus Woesearchaeota archaeon]MBT6519330.1 hypothetical protein [Candidatus Woesearchaeota archaeon]MBT7366790.1 hypothetical protein [Candidatus Woesearchaeota archaeon]